MHNIIRLKDNEPLIVKLDNARGFESQGKRGTDYRFDVNGDSWLYLPQQGAAALERNGAKAGDRVEILKLKHPGQGEDYRIRVVTTPQAHGIMEVDRQVEHVPARPQLPARVMNPQAHPYGGNATYWDRQNEQPAAPKPPAVQPYPKPSPTKDLLIRCMEAAIDAAIEGEAYAESKGRELEFLSDDIRSMMISIYIAKTKEQQENRRVA